MRENSETRLAYMPELDGLRAIAVASVVAYHAGLPVPGGFAGVDVFFVISGFLITKLLLAEVAATGTISIMGFYARRARRILPAFFLVMSVTFALGLFLYRRDGDALRDFASTFKYAAAFLSNLHFAATDSYFGAPAESNLLLHTWSLSVEEQFYLVWPVLLLLIAALGKIWRVSIKTIIVFTLLVVIAASLAFSAFAATTAGWEQIAFYHPQSRAWQLGLGALLAAAGWSTVRGMASLGLLAIVVSFFVLSAQTPYPGLAALGPSLGAAAVIAGMGPQSAGLTMSLLRSSPFVTVGRLSYGWYLWHWPLLVAVRSLDLGQKDIVRDGLVALLALAAAAVMYRYIEQPIRTRRVFSRASERSAVVVAVGLTTMTILGTNSAISITKRPHAREQTQNSWLEKARGDINPRSRTCHESPKRHSKPLAACVYPATKNAEILIWGDSHADHFVPAFDDIAARNNFGVAQRTKSGCDATEGVDKDVDLEDDKALDCETFNARTVRDLKKLKHLRIVVLGGRWSSYDPAAPLSPHRSRKHTAGNPDRMTELQTSLRLRVEQLRRAGYIVYVVADIPEQKFNPISCLATETIEKCSIGRDEALAYKSPSTAALQRAISGIAGAYLLDPKPELCNGVTCPVARGNSVLYRDADHLTVTGAKLLVPWFAKAMQGQLSLNTSSN